MNAAYVGAPNSGNRIKMPVHNDASAGASIPAGTPVVLSVDGTHDGMDVALPSNKGQTHSDLFFFGVVTDTLTAGQPGESVVWGLARGAMLVRATRAANTDNWVGSTSIASAALLSIDTVNNAFVTAAAATGSITRRPLGFLANDLASFASTLSTATSYGTALTILTKAFVRAL